MEVRKYVVFGEGNGTESQPILSISGEDMSGTGWWVPEKHTWAFSVARIERLRLGTDPGGGGSQHPDLSANFTNVYFRSNQLIHRHIDPFCEFIVNDFKKIYFKATEPSGCHNGLSDEI